MVLASPYTRFGCLIKPATGEIEIRANGETVILASRLFIRTSGDSYIQGLHFETFFGGKLAICIV